MFGLRGIDCHVIVDKPTSEYLKKMAGQIANETGLQITSNRKVRSASMKFHYEAFARRYSTEIVKLLEDRPKGLRLLEYKHDERVDPSAKGVEAYSVAHDFEAEGSGIISGRVDLLVQLKRSFADCPLIKASDIILK